MIQIPKDINIIPKTKGAYIVGGSIRDLALGRSPIDYDVIVSGNPEEFAKKIAANTSGHLVEIGKPEHKVIRVVSNDNIFDISSANSQTIEDNLNKRDFTINAMAYSLYSGEIIDCLNGMQDIADKKVRMVSKEIFRKDPIRLIRAFRMEASLNFEIEPQTVSAIKNDANLIKNSAGERIRTELFKILPMPKSYYYLSGMANTGLLTAIFPELGKLQGCSQNKYHLYDVFEHTMKAYYYLETMLNNKFPPEIYQDIDRSKATLLKYAILLHDIGKTSTKTVDSRGNIHFYGHGQKGADMANKISKRLKLSTRETCYIDFIIRNHIRTLFLFTAHKKKTLTRKSLTRFFIKCGDNTSDLLLHTIADIKGKGNEENERDKVFIEFAKEILHDFFSGFKPIAKESPFITGYDLINKFGLTPSPVFKTILSHVKEAKLSGKIKNRQEALKLAEEIIKIKGLQQK